VYLKKTLQKSGRIYLSIVDGYFDKEKGHSRTVTVEKIGYLDELEREYDDPIAHFKNRVEQLKQKKAEKTAPVTLSFEQDETLSFGQSNRKNFGYMVLSHIYHQLKIDQFLTNKQRQSKIDYNTNDIMKLLVFSRLLYPASKKKTYDNRRVYYDKHDYSLDDTYRALSFFYKHSSDLQVKMNDRIKELYSRQTDLVYYDVTNYYFETDIFDEFRKKGVSKEHRPNPIVQMGLFMDKQGIPITFELFPGNTNDCLTFRPGLKRIHKEYNLGKVIVVADKGMTTGDNIHYTLSGKHGYVFSMSVRGANKKFKEYVLDESGYTWHGSEYKRKSRLEPREIQVTSKSGKKLKKTVHEKQVIFYSEKYAKKAKLEREKVIQKAMDIVDNPGKYTRSSSYGAAGYIKNIRYDKETGEIANPQRSLQLDTKKLQAEAALDGYYAIITSEYKEKDDRIIDIYRGLWRIEESFRVTKSDLEARPVYVSKMEHIHAHFLTCFIALVIARIIEVKLDYKYSVGRILNSLSKAECTHMKQNYYLFDYYDEVLKDLGEIFSINFAKKIRSQGEIKKFLAASKKS
jgi:transposase